MEKKWSLIFFALCLIFAFSMSPVEAQAEKGPRCSDEIDNDGDGKIDCGTDDADPDPDCKCGGGGGGGDKVVGQYDVKIDGTLTDFPWSGHANESRIDGGDLPGLIDLDFFVNLFDGDDNDNGLNDGVECFESLSPSPVGFGGVQRKPGDTAWGQFWFPGCTKAGAVGGVCDQEVLYQLIIFGTFDDEDDDCGVEDDAPCFVFPLEQGALSSLAAWQRLEMPASLPEGVMGHPTLALQWTA